MEIYPRAVMQRFNGHITSVDMEEMRVGLI